MSIMAILGILMLIVPFVSIFFLIANDDGYKEAFIIFGIVFFMLLWLITGVLLICGC